MRTLDEMIKEFELEELSAKGRYEGGGWYLIGGDELSDAIHYLRGYRDSKAWIDLEKKITQKLWIIAKKPKRNTRR